jgi:AcrR family transcriptional regulator
MADAVNPPRRYRSPRREEQAQATRRAVLDAALALFVEHGYAATAIGSIARLAKVSAETVYAVFGSKRRLLAELIDVVIAGGQEALPVLEQPWVDEIRRAADPRQRLRILARHGSAILARRAAIDEVVRGAAAADPEIAALWHRGREERFVGQRALLQLVIDGGALRPGLDLDAAAAILYAIGSPETYLALVADRGWTQDQFERWYGDALEWLLLTA